MEGFFEKWRNQRYCRDQGGENPGSTAPTRDPGAATPRLDDRGRRSTLVTAATSATAASQARCHTGQAAEASDGTETGEPATPDTLATSTFLGLDDGLNTEVALLQARLIRLDKSREVADRWFEQYGPEHPLWDEVGRQTDKLWAEIGSVLDRLWVLGLQWDGEQAVPRVQEG